MEVLVAFVLLMAVVLPASLLLGRVMAQESSNRASVAAGQIAEQALESSHGVLSAAMVGSCNGLMPCTVPQADQTVSKITYHTTLAFKWALIGNASADVCTSLVVPQVASATATVNWGPGRYSLSESSVVNLPYTPTNLNNGFLAVQVNGVTNNAAVGQIANFGQSGVVVTVTSDTAATETFPVTDSQGCAFAAVPANLSSTCPASTPTCTNYTITLSRPAGSSATYVDQQLNAAPSSTITVAPTAVVGPPVFTYDKAATITLTYPSVTEVEGGVTCPLPTLCLSNGQHPAANPSFAVSATTFNDQKAANNATGVGGVSYDGGGPWGAASSAVLFDGITGFGQTANSLATPGPQTFTLAAWFKTTVGGSIIGFTNAQGASGTSFDRQVWVDPSGFVDFGVNTGSATEVRNTSKSYKDGTWHFVVAELSSSGMALSVDGSAFATNAAAKTAQSYTGWWHLGWSGAASVTWANPPKSGFFGGSLGQVAIFPTALPLAQVTALTTASSASVYSTAVTSDGASSYYPLNSFTQNGLSAGTPTASLLSYPGTGSTWFTVTTPPGLSRLNAVTCPSALLCVGVGSSSSGTGMILSGGVSAGTWAPAALLTNPGTDLSSITCPSTTFCMAAGYNYNATTQTRTGVLLSSTSPGTSWNTVPTSGFTIIRSISCPTTSKCIGDGWNGATAPRLFTFTPVAPPATPTLTTVVLSPVATALGPVTCPAGSGATFTCFVAGATASSSAALWSTINTGTAWAAVTLTAGVTSLGTPVCTTTTACLVPANSASTGTVLKLTGGSPFAVAATTGFPSSQWISAVACQSTTCFATGQGPIAAGSPSPVLATITSVGTTWSSVTIPGSTTQAAITGLGCGSFGCVAVGESTGSDLLYSYLSGAWGTNSGPNSSPGMVGTGFSASVTNSLLAGGLRQVATSQAGVNPGLLATPLYPFANGYSVFPGSCQLEASSPLPTTAPGPGGSATALAQLANVSLDVLNTTGQPIPNVTVSATAAMSGCVADTIALPTTGGNGQSAAGFSLGTYTLKVNGTALASPIVITNSGVTYNSVSYPEPATVPIVVNLP